MNEQAGPLPGAPRFVIGIDLGTTNSAVAWGELAEETISGVPSVRRFAVPQLVAHGELASRSTLPSFLYLPTASERAARQVGMPWNADADRVAGAWARDHGALLAGRLVSSAKSWLCHPDVDRRAAILPWEADPAERVCSPVEASRAYLEHLRDAWNHRMASGADRRRLERQDIVLTVPASFDEEARELTVEAARAAGFDHLTLVEEPTAALYAWITSHRHELGRHLRAGDLVLVCDVGGGTTDFTLVKVSAMAEDLAFDRVAVGDHLLLGGDNLDLAIARSLETTLGGASLTLRQRQALRRQCADAKERLLADDAPERMTLTLLGTGRSLVGGVLTVDVTAEAVRRLLIEGFLPAVEAHARPGREARPGLRELGLPYESDPAITRHLAAFLAEAGGEAGPARPDAILLNGGFFTPAAARDRLVQVLESWFAVEAGEWRPRVLVNESPATAVAEGAAAYGLVRHGFGLRIGGGSARAYYIGLQSPDAAEASSIPAVCVLSRGAEEGADSQRLSREFTVVANRPRAFSLWSSRTGREAVGDVVALDRKAVHPHAPLIAELRFGKRSRAATLPVHMEVAFTALGTLELWLVSHHTDHRWRLRFELRGPIRQTPPVPTDSDSEAARRATHGSTDTTTEGRSSGVSDTADAQALVHRDAIERASTTLRQAFTPGQTAAVPPEQLPAHLEAVLGLGRLAWSLDVVRPLSDVLLEQAEGRRISSRHEARWLNLLGFCLRPGFGATLDDFRMGQARKVYLAGLAFPGDVQCQAEWLVLWQRLAGGLTAGQQQDIFHRLAQPLLASLAKKGRRLAPQVERETWRLLASLERIPPATRATLGDQLIARLEGQADQASLWWALGRIGARTPTYGPLNSVVSPAKASAWLARALDLCTARVPDQTTARDARESTVAAGEALAALADLGAYTGDAARDIGEDLRQQIERHLSDAGATEAMRLRLREVRASTRAEWQRRYGESIPEGLTLTR
jgi:molecular chaperone DnaK (HSP70)